MTMNAAVRQTIARAPTESFAGRPVKLQTKLAIGSVDDPLEREADRVADQVMSSSGPAAMGGAPVRVQRFASGDSSGSLQSAPPSVERTLASSGRPLEPAVRHDMEQRFSHDFSNVRVHTDDGANASACDISAQAYTVGSDIVFAASKYAPNTQTGQRLLAHELTHVTQQNAGLKGDPEPRLVKQTAPFGAVQRVPAPPRSEDETTPFDRSKIDVQPISDIKASFSTTSWRSEVPPQTAKATFQAPIIHLDWELYDPTDKNIDASGAVSTPGNTATFVIQSNDPSRPKWDVTQGRYILRAIGYDSSNAAVAYAERSFYVWTSSPTGKPPDIAALEKQKTDLEAITQKGSGKSFGEVGSAYAKLKDVTHDLSVLETGTGTYVGKQCPVVPAGTTKTDCTDIVLEVLENTFTQQGHGADWSKVKKKFAENTKARGDTRLSGLDVQAALQSEAGWKGIFWAPDPDYQVPKAELDKANSNEASYAYKKVKGQGTYYKDFGKGGYPGVSISQSVVNYAPETPKEPRKAGYPAASTTTKDTSQLNKLKKLPFGVLAAHGGQHMTIITYGKVIEVHWGKEATSADVIEQTDLEQWAVGPQSGYHYYASGAIVAPAAEVDTAFK